MREKSVDEGQRPKRWGPSQRAEGFARGSSLEIAHSPSLGTVTGLLRGTGKALTPQLQGWSNFPHTLRKSAHTPELPSLAKAMQPLGF